MHDLLYRLAWPALKRLDPEQVHRLAVVSLKRGLMRPTAAADDPILATRVFGLDFANPIGLGAGFDKHAEVIDAMFGFGFGFVEAGTVTPKPQPGNSGQRLFRLDEDEAVINRFGFNSEGLEPFVERLKARRAKGARGGIVGANIGKNRSTEDAAADYETCIAAVAPLVDYVVVNVSSPNTPGLRGLQARAPIEALVGRVLAARDRVGAAGAEPAPKRPPILLKVGPDLDEDQVRDIAEVVLDTGVDGLIVGNTTVTRPPTLRSRWRDAEGGLSGRPLMGLATECLRSMYRHTQGRVPIIGCGGVSSGEDAYVKIRAGASLVQLYSALVYNGPGFAVTIKRDLAALLRRDGFATIAAAVGADHRPL
ncbi:quinone-dependent dihydroorotate dehydrogenase [Rhodoplanes sp. TEM]|uniref:Dihydroorotate dehydrogenase (quinone) n=1 Tax=Rhodoplanes tepidamans TaxID=200616 RepID=A0ABT5JK42_RHOTP|nr:MULTISPECIES: quinone-dependent dihydroorotate dehydrogenase [Rhodoplanes]MDC7789922.1 quinone-dependent dihydroorotate dehydrogenase [Rhodoplanes tepidamans]MDC7988091.1 quinone-dependent dihydroorotate dehydrogenase [Rhodoplanes sp. TEM]MDQ0358927.1 dihydroorotate dehydrogenase [Rhodoplanes tepidamans]